MDQLPDFDEDTPLSTRFLYPGDWWDKNSLTERDHVFLAIESLVDADKVAITDNDADGLGSAAILTAAFPDQSVAHLESGHGGSGLSVETAIETAATYCPNDLEVFITDICLDGEETDLDAIEGHLEQLQSQCTVRLYDHHDWTEDVVDRVDAVVDDLVIEDDDVCAADITFNELEDRIADNNPDALERLRNLAEVTRDHDLWIKENPKSGDISDFSFWADTQTYIETVREHGPDITDDPEVAEMLAENREDKEARIQLAVENAEWYEVEGRTVALAYGNFYHSEAGNRLVTGDGNAADEADIAVLIQPWNKVSLRSDDDFPYCSALARTLGGGGHPTAAGCKTNALGASGPVSYREFWESEGEIAKRIMLEVLRVGFEKIDAGELTADSEEEEDTDESDESTTSTTDAEMDTESSPSDQSSGETTQKTLS